MWLAPLVVLAILSIGCAGGRSHLVGFPVGSAATPREAADRVEAAIQQAELLLTEVARQAAAEAPSAASRPATPPEVVATRRILDAYVALAADDLGAQTGLLPFDYMERRQPLFLYPRVTFPHIAECEGSGAEQKWTIPVLLNRAALRKTAAYRRLFGSALTAAYQQFAEDDLSHRYDEIYASMRKRFHVSLVPRRDGTDTEISIDEGGARWIAPRSLRVEEGASMRSGPFRIPFGRPDAIDVAFEIPASVILSRWEKLEAQGSAFVRGELFDLRFFPKIEVTRTANLEQWSAFADAVKRGDWIGARKEVLELDAALGDVDAIVPRLRPAVAEHFRNLAREIRAFVASLAWFAEGLDPVANRADRIAAALEDELPVVEVKRRVRDLGIAIGQFLDNDPSPAPVFLDEPRVTSQEFRFIVGADLQYDTDSSCLQQFLATIDESMAPGAAASGDGAGSDPKLEWVRSAKFAIIVGDFGDGRGLSSTPTAAIGDALGLATPKSPYAEHSGTPRRGEFPELRERIRRSRMPIFAVPGNHDGFVNYGGILNQLTLASGRIVEAVPIVSILGELLVSISNDLPILFKIWRISPPFYDGLVDWGLELGPRNLAFQYRGCGFVAANSFDLHQFARDQVGALANNWGGGMQDATLAWFDASLRHFSSVDRAGRNLTPLVGSTFVFMHHDPRASIASKNGYVEKNFGQYNTVTTPMTELTFGYLGTSSAFFTNLWIPILTPVASDVISAATSGEDFQQRWMRDTAWDENCSNARPLLETINRNLTGAPSERNEWTAESVRSARISHLFFGHDDVPIEGDWIHRYGNNVFPDQTSDDGWSGFGNALEGFFFRTQTKAAPAWAADMHFDDGRNARVVRLDDLGDAFSSVNTHGFAVVTVNPSVPGSGAPPRATTRWVPLPR